MAIKITLCFGVAIFLTLISKMSAIECDYTCNGDGFIMKGVPFQCPAKYTCVSNSTLCKPCVLESQKCKDIFTCVTGYPKDFVMNGYRGTCPQYYKCNSKNVGDCDPCIDDCGEKQWTCLGNQVIMNNMLISCPNGMTCNDKNVVPCTACIPNSITTPEPTTLPSTPSEIDSTTPTSSDAGTGGSD